MIIRPAICADLPQATAVASASYIAAFAPILGASAQRAPASFAGRFAESLARLRVAVAAGRVVGFSLATGAHLDMLFVDPDAQGGGAGRALLEEAVGRGVCSLECFRANLAARRFYERAGWVVTRGYSRPFAGRLHDFVYLERNAR